MPLEILRSKDYKKLPWKNGRGITTEILISPKGAIFSQNSFEWRLSSAVIEEPGKFSFFPGFDRVLAIIDGEEIILHDESLNDTFKLKKGEAHYFAGENSIRSELPRGPVKDLNWIFRRGVESKFEMINLSKNDYEIPAGGMNLIYVLEGSVSPLQKGLRSADSGDTIVIEKAKQVVCLRAAETRTSIAHIRVEPRE